MAFCFGLSGSLAGCKRFERKHVPVEKVEELGYPTCPGSTGAASDELVAEQHLRSGPAHTDKGIVERYSIQRRDCLFAVSVRQEWPMGTADVEVLYDKDMMPLRIWKRMTLPGLPDAGEKADIRRYDLRTDPVSMKRRQMSGAIDFELLKGGHPVVVIGPGRGLISMWIKRAKLKVGEKVRELAIDVRGLEKIGLVTLRREDDMVHDVLGPVRVYTFYGREAVFTDEHDVVIGDLAGLLPDKLVKEPAPPAIPLYGVVDPVGTP
ncbi:MAG: hypothetical protein QM778_05105 [Myxococcales bacterium]